MTHWQVEFTKTAIKDLSQLTEKQRLRAKELIRQIAENPSIGKALVGDLKGYFSVRLNLKDRIVYRKEEDRLVIMIVRCKSHYGD